MKFILNWVINAAILYISSTQLQLIELQSFSTALFLSFVAALITFLIRMVVVPLKFFGCLTFGLSYILGLVLSLFAIPLALYISQNYVGGFALIDMQNTIIVSVLIALSNYFLFGKKQK